MLTHKILLIKPEDRKTSEIMESMFDDILSQLKAPPSLNRSETIAIERSVFDNLHLRSTEDKAPKDEVSQYGLSLPSSTRRSKFSICGEYLAYFAPDAISFYETRRIIKTPKNRTPKMCGSSRAARIAQPSAGSVWVDFEIGSTYLAAFTDREYFDVGNFSCRHFPTFVFTPSTVLSVSTLVTQPENISLGPCLPRVLPSFQARRRAVQDP